MGSKGKEEKERRKTTKRKYMKLDKRE